jgi:hypothetical protein
MARGRAVEANGIHRSPGHPTAAEHLVRYEEGDNTRMGMFQLACNGGQEYREFTLPIPSRSEQLRSDKADIAATGPQVRRRTAVAVSQSILQLLSSSLDSS